MSTRASATPSPTRRSRTSSTERRPQPRPRLPARARWRSTRPPRPVVDPAMAADIVWLDAFVTNPDRTVANPNLLVWHGRLWCIDHGAALYIHHTWRDPGRARARGRSSAIARPRPAAVRRLDRGGRRAAGAAARIASCSAASSAAIPDAWLPDDRVIGGRGRPAGGLRRYLRGAGSRRAPFVEEAERARRAA